jgi:hypothetical protein
MVRKLRSAGLVVVLALGLGLVAGGPPAGAAGVPHAVEAATPLSPPAYVALMNREVLGPFTSFGTSLGRITSAQKAIAAGPRLRALLKRMRIGLNRVNVARAADLVLEKQRKRIVAAGYAGLPPLTRFVNAVARADKKGLQAALPGVRTAMNRFARSAQV